LIALKEARRGFVDLERLFALRAVYGADEIPIGVKKLDGGAVDAFEI